MLYHVRCILYAPMAILLPVALTAIFMIFLLLCVMPLEKILLTRRQACVRHQGRREAKLLTMRKVSSILTIHSDRANLACPSKVLRGQRGYVLVLVLLIDQYHFSRLSPGVRSS